VDALSLIALLVAAVLLVLATGLRWVPEGEVRTVHRFGRYVRTLGPGLHLVWPLVDRSFKRLLMIGHHLEVPKLDLNGVEAGADLYYQILDPARAGDKLERIDTVVCEETRQAMIRVVEVADGASLPSAEELKRALNERLSLLGLRVIRCSLVTG